MLALQPHSFKSSQAEPTWADLHFKSKTWRQLLHDRTEPVCLNFPFMMQLCPKQHASFGSSAPEEEVNAGY